MDSAKYRSRIKSELDEMGHSYTEEDVDQLRRGQGERLYGDGALVVLKALLESGISYFGGYPGSPTANLMDAVADAYDPLLKEYGVYFESSSNEMSAGALLTTSVYGPVRGAVTWKVVGNGVATDVVDHVSQLGVKDGAMIVVGEDYGVSSTTVVQRTLAWGIKSGLLVIDPRADQQLLHRMVKEGMDLSRDSKSVVALLLRPQASHTNAEIIVGDNVIPQVSTVRKVDEFKKDPTLFALPPFAQEQEKDRYLNRLPTAARLVVERGLNEYFGGERAEFGLITHGTTYNTTMRVLSLLGMADEFGNLDERLHLLQLNVINPLSESQIESFMDGKKSILIVEEGQPDLIEQQIRALANKRGLTCRVIGHDMIPGIGELVPERLVEPLSNYLIKDMGIDADGAIRRKAQALLQRGREVMASIGKPVPGRIPTFCTGCPERPVFSQMKIKEVVYGEKDWHAGDVGCYGMAGFKPFEMADSNIGMGAGLAAATAITAMSKQKNVSVVGDGTLWHSAFNTSVANGIYNKQESTYIVLDNAWTAMTGAHENPNVGKLMTGEPMNTEMSIEKTFRAMGVNHIETANPYDFKGFQKKFIRIHEDKSKPQVRVLISDAECQLQRQRRVKPQNAAALKAGKRVAIDRLYVDDQVCVGDHACMRFNGCPSLTLKPSEGPVKKSDKAYIDQNCVGCGVCGEISTMAQLCPSFVKVTTIANPTWMERIAKGLRSLLLPRHVSLALEGK